MKRAGVETVRRFDFYHARKCLFLGMRHGYLGRLSLETVHHPLQPGNFFLLRVVILHQLFVVFFFTCHKVCVVSRITDCSPVLNLIDNVNNIIQKHAVMGYHDDCLRIIFQIVLQPLDGCNIQMVGRLVQKQDIRFA